MTPAEVHQLARRLMDAHALADWNFAWDNARKRRGCCHYSTRTITLSRYLTPHRDPAAVEQTILHEIAHALVGPGHGHGRVWRAKARSIGYTGGTSSTDRVPEVEQKSRYVGHCDRCGREFARHRFDSRLLGRPVYRHRQDGGLITFALRAA